MISFRPLTADDIEARVQQVTEKGCSVLLYKDARCDMRILDETVGAENWDCRYDEVAGKLFCTVGIKCGPEWVYKQDVGVPSNMEAEKGEASDAFKRACFKWGIGRELYTAPFIWVNADKLKSHCQKDGRWLCRDRFHVKAVEILDGRIVGLTIANAQGAIVYSHEQRQWNHDRFAKVRELKGIAEAKGIDGAEIDSWIEAEFAGRAKKDLSASQLKHVEQHIEELIRSADAQ